MKMLTMGSPWRSFLRTILLLLLSRSTPAFVPSLSLQAAAVAGRHSTTNDAKQQPRRTTCLVSLAAQNKSFLDNLLAKTVAAVSSAAPVEQKKKEQPPPPVVIDRDYRVAAVFLAAGLLLDFIPYLQFIVGLPVTLLGLLFLVQTYRVRFVFDASNNLAIRIGDELKESGENLVVGGANVWSCDSIVNYDFFPTGWIDSDFPYLDIPILVYFKETQTDSATWEQGPGRSANDPAKIAAGTAVAGQVHFFPAVCNAKQIRDEFIKRKCGKVQ